MVNVLGVISEEEFSEHHDDIPFLENYFGQEINTGDMIMIRKEDNLLFHATDIFIYMGDGDNSDWVIAKPGGKKLAKERKIITKCKTCGASLPVNDDAIIQGYVTCLYCRTTFPSYEYVDDEVSE